jgi:hypothetical protein
VKNNMVDYVEGVCLVCGERGQPCACIRALGGGGGGGMSIEDEDRRQQKWDEQQRRKREWEERQRKEQERKERERRQTASGGSLVFGMIRQLFSRQPKKKPKITSSGMPEDLKPLLKSADNSKPEFDNSVQWPFNNDKWVKKSQSFLKMDCRSGLKELFFGSPKGTMHG